ncbi:MAG: hypothetical protein EBT18_08850 [Gammaproteobacteria bacterium]|nr:hypothetical protein [Gammaproteobacteria bacterium]
MGDFVLDGAAPGFSSFSEYYTNGDSFFYAITDGEDYEVGSGVYNVGASNTITRFPIQSTDSDSLVDFTAGVKEVFVTYPGKGAVFSAEGHDHNQQPADSGVAFYSTSQIVNYDRMLIWDSGKARLTRADLAAQNFYLNDDAKRARILNPHLRVNYEKLTGRQYGWYIDLPSSGERVIAEARVRGNMLFFNTVIPDISVCASGGSGWEMSVKLENGGSPSGPIFDFNEDGVIAIQGDTARVTGASIAEGGEDVGYAGKKLEEEQGMPAGPSIIGNRRFTPGSATDEANEIEQALLISNEGTVSGRLSWEQLFSD